MTQERIGNGLTSQRSHSKEGQAGDRQLKLNDNRDNLARAGTPRSPGAVPIPIIGTYSSVTAIEDRVVIRTRTSACSSPTQKQLGN